MTEILDVHDAVLAVIEQSPVLRKTGELSLGSSKIKTLTNDEVLDKIGPIVVANHLHIYPIEVSDNPLVWIGGTPRNMNGAEVDDTKVRPLRLNRMLTYTFRIWHTPSKTYFDAQVPGEGMGSDDKGSRKATTSAQKTLFILLFQLITGEPDPDAETYSESEVKAEAQNRGAQQRAIAKTPGARTAVTAPKSTNPAATIAAANPPVEQPEPEVRATAAPVASEAADNSLDGLKARMRDAVTRLGGPSVFTKVQVDELATAVTGKADRSDWINSPQSLRKLVEAVEGKVRAAEDEAATS